jgi:hypothetical protein
VGVEIPHPFTPPKSFTQNMNQMFFHINILLLCVDVCLHVAAVLSKSINIRFVEKTGSEHLLEHTKIYNLLPP